MSVLVLYGLLSSISLSAPAETSSSASDTASDMQAYKSETLFGGDVARGMAASVVYRTVSVNADKGSMIGVRADYVVNHAAFVGIAGFLPITGPKLDAKAPAPGVRYLRFGYGGLDLGYTMASHKLIHASLRGLLGVGRVNHHSDLNGDTSDASVFYVAEPSLQIDLNINEMLRASVGGGYRFTSGIIAPKMASNGLDGVNVDLSVEASF